MDTSPQTALVHIENAQMSTFSWIQDRKTEPSNRNQANQRSLSSGLHATPNTQRNTASIHTIQVINIIPHSETETEKSASPPPCPADIVTRYPDNRTTIPHASSWHHGGEKKNGVQLLLPGSIQPQTIDGTQLRLHKGCLSARKDEKSGWFALQTGFVTNSFKILVK